MSLAHITESTNEPYFTMKTEATHTTNQNQCLEEQPTYSINVSKDVYDALQTASELLDISPGEIYETTTADSLKDCFGPDTESGFWRAGALNDLIGAFECDTKAEAEETAKRLHGHCSDCPIEILTTMGGKWMPSYRLRG